MNYSRSIKKASIGRRIVISWLIVAAVFSLIGLGIGVLIPKSGTVDIEPEEASPDVLIYGAPDGKIYEGGFPESYELENDFVFTTGIPVTFGEDLQEFTYYLSAAYDIDYTLVLAIISKESAFMPDGISSTNDYGLMQINACNHEWLTEELGITDFIDPYENIKAGLFILRGLFEKYDSTSKVLMAYNMGENGASKLWEQGIFESNYSKDVLQRQETYRQILGWAAIEGSAESD
jgi:hypothetical protein